MSSLLSINDRPVDRAAAVRSDPAMPKYDAFGREIGEDSLESLGWSSGGTVTPSPEPAPEAPPRRHLRRPAGCHLRHRAAARRDLGTPPPTAPTAGDPLAGGDPFAAPPPPPPPARYRRRRGGARVMSRLVGFAVFVVIAVNVVPGFFNGVKDATDGLNIDIPDIDDPGRAGDEDREAAGRARRGVADPPRPRSRSRSPTSAAAASAS